MKISTILGLLGVSLILVILWIKKIYSIWKDLGVPYEKPHLLYGNMKKCESNQPDGEFLEKFYKQFKGEGRLAGIFLSFQPVALILDLALVKDILIKDFPHFHDRGLFTNEKGEPISANLAALKGEKWKDLRLKFAPTFTSEKMKNIFPIILGVDKSLEAYIMKVSSRGGYFDAKDMASRYTIDVIAACFFGLECDSLNHDDSEFFRIARSVFESPRHGLAMTILLVSYRKYAEVLGFKNYRDDVSEFFARIVRDTVNLRMANGIQKNDFMDLLISMYNEGGNDHLSFKQLLAHLFACFASGYETVSRTIQSCFFELARNPKIQDKLRDHIVDAIEKNKGEVSFNAVFDMKYLDQVIMETLRMYPPVPTITRETTLDYRIRFTRIILKQGTIVMIPAYAIQHDPEFYPDPSIFDPDRFSAENVEKRPEESFLSFGLGPRQCIAGRLGMLQVKMALMGVLRKHRLYLSPEIKQPVQLHSRLLKGEIASPVWIRPERIQ